MFAIPSAHAKITYNSACTRQFLKFACIKHASTHMYLHTCVKFNLSCTVYWFNVHVLVMNRFLVITLYPIVVLLVFEVNTIVKAACYWHILKKSYISLLILTTKY